MSVVRLGAVVLSVAAPWVETAKFLEELSWKKEGLKSKNAFGEWKKERDRESEEKKEREK